MRCRVHCRIHRRVENNCGPVLGQIGIENPHAADLLFARMAINSGMFFICWDRKLLVRDKFVDLSEQFAFLGLMTRILPNSCDPLHL